jgi:hypothetical protein
MRLPHEKRHSTQFQQVRTSDSRPSLPQRRMWMWTATLVLFALVIVGDFALLNSLTSNAKERAVSPGDVTGDYFVAIFLVLCIPILNLIGIGVGVSGKCPRHAALLGLAFHALNLTGVVVLALHMP